MTLGVEEELLLLDAETLEPASRAEAVVEPGDPRIKHELFASIVEITTPVCSSVDEVLERLVALRAEVARRAARAGLLVAATGTHPSAAGAAQRVVAKPHYLEMKEALGDAVYRQLVCGLHVHVGMPSGEAAFRAFRGVLPALPDLLAESANSPWWEGEESGLRSTRAARLAELPAGGAPPALDSFASYRALVDSGGARRMWWDARPHPTLPTLEVRVCDQPTDVARSALLAARVAELAAAALEGEPPPYDREAYVAARREAAVRGGGPEAERQLELGRAEGLRELAADLVERSLVSP